MVEFTQTLLDKKEALEDLLDRTMRRQSNIEFMIETYDKQGDKGEVAKYKIELEDTKLIVEVLQEAVDKIDEELRACDRSL